MGVAILTATFLVLVHSPASFVGRDDGVLEHRIEFRSAPREEDIGPLVSSKERILEVLDRIREANREKYFLAFALAEKREAEARQAALHNPRNDCDAIDGTSYRGTEEQKWYQENCMHRDDCSAISGTEYQNTRERNWFRTSCVAVVSSTSGSEAGYVSVSGLSPSNCSSGSSFTAKASAYSSTSAQTDGDPFSTATGTQVHWGTIAVDPAVIPYGCMVVISAFPGTVFTAEDTGGAILGAGERIDIWFPSTNEALNFGVQFVTVTVQ